MSGLGWLKLHRELMNKSIWTASSPEQKVILITLLMMANYYENEWEWQGEQYTAKPGQFVTSLQSIVNNAGKGITIQNVRTALNRFEKYGFLTNESTNKNRLITIVNWELYQSINGEANKGTNKQLTSNQQATNKQLTTNKEYKNIRSKESKNNIYIVEQIINHLNSKANTHYKPNTSKTKSLIQARFNEGFTVEDFKTVIDIKTAEWLKDKEMNKYLRPETLFGTKFESYLNQPRKEVEHHEHEIYRSFGKRL